MWAPLATKARPSSPGLRPALEVTPAALPRAAVRAATLWPTRAGLAAAQGPTAAARASRLLHRGL
eukprot:10725926-Lingulodinium_polyedra.AAC.1